MAHRILLDTSSLMFRAFFSVPASIKGADGKPVNAVRGYLDMTADLIRGHHPDQVVHAYDHDWKPAPRVAAYAGYKAQRLPDPEGLPEQFTLLRRVLDAVGMTQAEAEDWEAEDAIGSLCASMPEGDRADIVTGDRDLIQLVRDPVVRVLFTVKGVRELLVLDEKGVRGKYGLPADRYAEFATLRGDPSDGLPGVRGVGEKTARALVEAYPSIEAMLEDAARDSPQKAPVKGSPQLRARLRDSAEYLAAMERVVPIRTDLDLRTWTGQRDEAALEAFADEHNLKGPLQRLNLALGHKA